MAGTAKYTVNMHLLASQSIVSEAGPPQRALSAGGKGCDAYGCGQHTGV